MRKLLVGLGLFFMLGGVALAWPYRSERIIGVAENNRTGCTINVQNATGWTSDLPVWGFYLERLKEPLKVGVAVYECGGVVGRRPAAMTLLAPGSDYRAEGCASSPGVDWCYADLPTAPRAAGAPHRYRLLIQVSPGEPVQSVEIWVSRQETWRSGTLDALMSV